MKPPIIGEAILYVDATPDEGYPLRILEVYRFNCNMRWSTSSSDVAEDTLPIVKAMNEMQEKRAASLDRAIAILRAARDSKESQNHREPTSYKES